MGTSHKAQAVDCPFSISVRFAVRRGLPLEEGKLEERTLSLSRRPDEVHRRSWAGAGMLGEMRTPSGWRSSASNSSQVELSSLQIRSFVFNI